MYLFDLYVKKKYISLSKTKIIKKFIKFKNNVRYVLSPSVS